MRNKKRKSGRWKQELCDTKAIVRFGQQIVVTQILCARREAKCAKAATEAEAKAATEAPSAAAAATRHTLQNADNARKMHAKRGKQIQKKRRRQK